MPDPTYQGSLPIPALAGDLAVAMLCSTNDLLRERGLTSGGPHSEVSTPIQTAALEIAKWALARQQTAEDSTPASDV
jgi:hypothetical protein